jgi:hypothetical protein
MLELQKTSKSQSDYCWHIWFVRLEFDFRNGSAFPIAKWKNSEWKLCRAKTKSNFFHSENFWLLILDPWALFCVLWCGISVDEVKAATTCDFEVHCGWTNPSHGWYSWWWVNGLLGDNGLQIALLKWCNLTQIVVTSITHHCCTPVDMTSIMILFPLWQHRQPGAHSAANSLVRLQPCQLSQCRATSA